MMSLKSTIIMLVCIWNISTDDNPVWANKFSQSFNEEMKYPIIGKGHTKGQFYYNWLTKQYRVDRDNGKWDRYCGSVYKFTDTPCSHIVNEGRRYLYFPHKNYCCMCCTDKGGCGVLKPNWLEGAEYKGEETSEEGKLYKVYNQKGLQDNLVYFEKESGIMARIIQQPNDDQSFDVKSYTENVDDSVFELPDICDPNKKCSSFSVCGALSLIQTQQV